MEKGHCTLKNPRTPSAVTPLAAPARKGGQWNPALQLLDEVDKNSLEVQAKRLRGLGFRD